MVPDLLLDEGSDATGSHSLLLGPLWKRSFDTASPRRFLAKAKVSLSGFIGIVFAGPASPHFAAFCAHPQTAEFGFDPNSARAAKQVQNLSATEEFPARARSQRPQNERFVPPSASLERSLTSFPSSPPLGLKIELLCCLALVITCSCLLGAPHAPIQNSRNFGGEREKWPQVARTSTRWECKIGLSLLLFCIPPLFLGGGGVSPVQSASLPSQSLASSHVIL